MNCAMSYLFFYHIPDIVLCEMISCMKIRNIFFGLAVHFNEAPEAKATHQNIFLYKSSNIAATRNL